MSSHTVNPPAVQSPPPTVISILILQQYPPGLWRITLGYSDGSTQSYGLIQKNVQYWIDQGATLTDNTGSFPVSPGAGTVAVVQSKVLSINVSDETIDKSS